MLDKIVNILSKAGKTVKAFPAGNFKDALNFVCEWDVVAVTIKGEVYNFHLWNYSKLEKMNNDQIIAYFSDPLNIFRSN